MKLCQLSNDDELHRYKKALVLQFAGPRHVLGTGPDNGGCQENLTAVFNVDINPGAGMGCVMRGDTYEEHMNIIAEEDLGLRSEKCTGLCTAASMDNVSIQTKIYEDFTVTAIVTAGIEHNGGRAGDPALWHEHGDTFDPAGPGTINILLHIDADLTPGAMARSLVTCTEAKAAAIQELQAPSHSSNGIATGSGTDGVIVISNSQSPTRLTNAGKNTKLGEYIGVTVKAAVKEALARQSGLTPAYQHNVLCRLSRFGITEDALWELCRDKSPEPPARKTAGQADSDRATSPEDSSRETSGTLLLTRAEFTRRMELLSADSTLVTWASLYAHLLDETEWGLLSGKEACAAAKELLALSGLQEQESDMSNARGGAGKVSETAVDILSHRYLEAFARKIICTADE